MVVEGAKQEPRLVRALIEAYGLGEEYEVYSYGTNIHELYERMFKDDDSDSLSLMGVLKERATLGDKHLFDVDYSDVLLVFDYDPHDNRFDPDGLVKMLDYFNDSTDEGRLYINYPMVEACKDFRSSRDLTFMDRKVDIEEIPNYKSVVGNLSRYQSYERDFTLPDLNYLVALTAAKACRVANPSANVLMTAEAFGTLDHGEVLCEQNKLLENRGEVWVLGTCLLFPAEYSQKLVSLDETVKDLFG